MGWVNPFSRICRRTPSAAAGNASAIARTRCDTAFCVNPNRRRASGRYAPSTVQKEKCRLRLGAGQAELPGVGWQAPGRLILAKLPDAGCDFRFFEPGDIAAFAVDDGLETLGANKLHGASTIFAHIGDQRKRVARRSGNHSHPITAQKNRPTY
jgi:hypothetical protein